MEAWFLSPLEHMLSGRLESSRPQLLKKNKLVELESALPAPVPCEVLERFSGARPPALRRGPARGRAPHGPLAAREGRSPSLALLLIAAR